MIEFKGSCEEDWLHIQGHRAKDIIKRLKEYKKDNPTMGCPLMGNKK